MQHIQLLLPHVHKSLLLDTQNTHAKMQENI